VKTIMSAQASSPPPTGELIVERGQRVVAIPRTEDGREVVRYVIETESPTLAADNQRPESVRVALSLAGAWHDLDWDETVEALDRIRHESQPTPPIDPNEL
jgi:hypothetical protein